MKKTTTKPTAKTMPKSHTKRDVIAKSSGPLRPVPKPSSRLASKEVETSSLSPVPVAEILNPAGPRPLSLKEKGVLQFLEVYIGTQGVAPTYQEICNHFGFASFNSVQRYLKQLEEKGYVQLPWANQKRAINILRPSSALQASVETVLRDHGGRASSVIAIDQVQTQLGQPIGAQSENFSLPLLGKVAAGAPIEAFEHDEFIDVPASLCRHADRTYALRVQGLSMIEDGILDGDVILVQRQSSASNGEIVVAMIGEEATVKRFYKKPQERQIELRPANSTMKSMWFDAGEVQIRGVVVGLIRKFT